MKGLIIVAVGLLGFSAQVSAAPLSYEKEVIMDQWVCETIPARYAGFIRAAGETVRITAPEHEKCQYEEVGRFRARVTIR